MDTFFFKEGMTNQKGGSLRMNTLPFSFNFFISQYFVGIIKQ